MEPLDVMLVAAPYPKIKLATALKLWSSNPPLGVAYIASFLREAHSVEIVDLNYQFTEDGAFQKYCEKRSPKLIGISSTSIQFPALKKILPDMREACPSSLIALGGSHASALKEQLLKDNKELDIIVYGEGEETMYELANGNSLRHTDGIIYREGNRITRTNPRKIIADLDTIPFPARDLLPMEFYSNPATLLTTRGCPYHCVYCDKSVFGYSWRFRSASNVLDEIELLSEKFPGKNIGVVDDSFNINRKRVLEICEGIKIRGIRSSISFENGLRANFMDEEIAKVMKSIGCNMLWFGMECLDQRVLDTIKKNLTVKQIFDAVAAAKKAGIRVGGFFIVDLPGATKEIVRSTYPLIRKLELDELGFAFATPYPGTELELWVNETQGMTKLSDIFDGDKDKPFFETKDFSKEDKLMVFDELCTLRNNAMLKKHLTPTELFRSLTRVRSFADFQKKLNTLITLATNKKYRYIT